MTSRHTDQLLAAQREAARYRALRDAVSTEDETFIDRMHVAMPKAVQDCERGPTTDEFDAAVDAAAGLRSAP